MFKRWILCLVFMLVSLTYASGQGICPAGMVCMTQETANNTATKLAELIEARKVIAEFLKERATFDVERATFARLQTALNDVIATGERISVMKDKVIAMYEGVIKLQNDLILKLETQLMKPKSGWAKFLDMLKTVASIAIGIAIGRGF